MPSKHIFLPGASGDTRFWEPVSNLLAYPAERLHIGWPGFGSTPVEPSVKGIGDLVERVIDEIQGPTALIAQSMGGVIAVLAALEKPQLVTHLVLTVTSGGVDMASFEAQDWRPSFFAANPSFPRWFSSLNEDLTEKISSLNTPTLLLWGDADPISPIRVGQRLASLIPHAKLHIFPGGDHFLANTLARNVAPLIDEHLFKAA